MLQKVPKSTSKSSKFYFVINFNAISLQANFDRIELCVTKINATVNIVAVSETWLADSYNGNLYELNG